MTTPSIPTPALRFDGVPRKKTSTAQLIDKTYPQFNYNAGIQPIADSHIIVDKNQDFVRSEQKMSVYCPLKGANKKLSFKIQPVRGLNIVPKELMVELKKLQNYKGL